MDKLEAISKLAQECLHQKLDSVAEEVEDLGSSMLPSKDEIFSKIEEIHSHLSMLERFWDDREWVPQRARQLLVPVISLIGEEQDRTKPWSTNELAERARTLAMDVQMVVKGKPVVATETANIEDLLLLDLKTEGSPRLSLFFLCLQSLRQKLRPNLWKHYPASLTAFLWLVYQVKYPYLSDFVGSVLSPCLLLVDDYNDENKILGLKLLKHVLTNVNKADLMQDNWALVMYNALMGLLHDSNPLTIELTVPLICDVLKVIEVDPNVNSDKFTKYDDSLRKILFALETSSGAAMKLVWLHQLTDVLRIMGHATLHYRDRIYEALLPLTVMCDKSVWTSLLDCIQVCIRNTWLCPNSSSVAEIVLRIVFNCSVLDVPNTTKTDREEILRLCKETLEFMKNCPDFGEVTSQIEEMKQNSDFHADFLNVLKNFNL